MLPTAALPPLDIFSVRLGDWKRNHTKYMLKKMQTDTHTHTHTHTHTYAKANGHTHTNICY